MDKNILVPIDFSPNSINALEYAIEIANKVNASIRIIFVKKDKNYENHYMIEEFAKADIKNADGILNKIIHEYQSKLDNTFKYSIRHGNISREITNEAKYNDMDLIIMGTHGSSGFQEFWAGSNAFRVVSTASCPVITVPDEYKVKTMDSITLPIDMTVATREKVSFTAELAQIFQSKVYITGVTEGNLPKIVGTVKKYISQVEKAIKSKEIAYEALLLSGKNIADVILSFSEEKNVNLISIMTEQPPNFSRAILGNYAQQMVNHSRIPVLSIHPKN